MPQLSAEQRFWKVVKQSPSGCWLWQPKTVHAHLAVRQPNGKYRVKDAWRWAWEHYVKTPIPKGASLKRTCPNPRCVNPLHREIVPCNSFSHPEKRPNERYVSYESTVGSRFHHALGIALFAD